MQFCKLPSGPKGLGAVHKLCCLKGGGDGGVKTCQFCVVKKTTKREGSKIADFETL